VEAVLARQRQGQDATAPVTTSERKTGLEPAKRTWLLMRSDNDRVRIVRPIPGLDHGTRWPVSLHVGRKTGEVPVVHVIRDPRLDDGYEVDKEYVREGGRVNSQHGATLDG